MKRIRHFLLLFPLLAASLAGCGTDPNVLQIALDDEDEGRYDELFAYFTEQTGYEIVATYGQDIGKLIGTKSEPDIIKTSTVLVTSMKDILRDLAPLIAESAIVDTTNYIDSLMNALTIEGKVYALPTSINTSLLYYNRALFDASADDLRYALGLSAEESVYPRGD